MSPASGAELTCITMRPPALARRQTGSLPGGVLLQGLISFSQADRPAATGNVFRGPADDQDNDRAE